MVISYPADSLHLWDHLPGNALRETEETTNFYQQVCARGNAQIQGAVSKTGTLQSLKKGKYLRKI